jgi:small subunit ribosomal protein S20
MPIIQSAKKRVKVAAKAAVRNSKTKRTLREAMKEFQTAIQDGKGSKISEALAKVTSAIDTAAKKNVIHKNKAARKKSQVAKAAKAAGAKTEVAKVTKKAPVAKKPVAKASAAKTVKKPVAKKATPKKTTKK